MFAPAGACRPGRLLGALLLLLALGGARPALAHSTDVSRSRIEIEEGRLRWVVAVDATDLAHALVAERDARSLADDPRVVEYARARISVGMDGTGSVLEASRVLAAPAGECVRIELVFVLPGAGALRLRDRFLVDADREHRDLARILVPGAPERGFVFGPAGDMLVVERRGVVERGGEASGQALGAALFLGAITLALFWSRLRA